MIDELLPFYNRELAFFRRLAGRFAEENPKIAGRLRLGPESSEDPHVERLIEAFAFLTARIRHKLDDDFPEISDALLNVLLPHCLAPLPSMCIVRFDLDRDQPGTSPATVPRGSEITTEPIDGEPCRFRTCYESMLWPIEIEVAELVSRPFQAPATPRATEAMGVIHLRLTCLSEEATIGDLGLDSLRIFLRGMSHHVNPLYELLFNNALEVAVATSPADRNPIVLPADSIRPVGFDPDDGMLPYSARSPLAYRLLAEYFTFPEKFLFFEIANLDRIGSAAGAQRSVDLYVYLDQTSRDLERNVTTDTFQLGCAPVVNLFQQRAEPINLTDAVTEHRLVPDARRPLATEVYSVDAVTAISPAGDEVPYRGFYSVNHDGETGDGEAYWFATRRPSDSPDTEPDYGTEIDLSLVDLQNRPVSWEDWVLDVETTCLNRDLPGRLPFGGDQPRLFLSGVEGPIARVTCLTAPTTTKRPQRREAAMWRLISHLSLGHLSLVEGPAGARALREILRLYDAGDSNQTRDMIESIVAVSSRRITGRVSSQGRAGICQGLEVTVQFRAESFSEKGTYLFARVLEHFLAMACTINSFTKLVVTLRGREGRLVETPPRSGEKVLV